MGPMLRYEGCRGSSTFSIARREYSSSFGIRHSLHFFWNYQIVKDISFISLNPPCPNSLPSSHAPWPPPCTFPAIDHLNLLITRHLSGLGFPSALPNGTGGCGVNSAGYFPLHRPSPLQSTPSSSVLVPSKQTLSHHRLHPIPSNASIRLQRSSRARRLRRRNPLAPPRRSQKTRLFPRPCPLDQSARTIRAGSATTSRLRGSRFVLQCNDAYAREYHTGGNEGCKRVGGRLCG